ncbi:type II secretion system protein [Paenibacillus sp. WLX2291]|uniref:type II secretion system protein n=1 Tax=Paenibacillus sp. WLX2291 TaxID=3296934 RepID=UPI003983EA69
MLTTNLKAFGKKGFKALGKDEKGFTLIELLAVIVILGIIAVIAVPLIGNIINNSRTNADLNTASQIYNAARMYVIGEQNGDFANAGSVTVQTLMDKGYLDKGLTLPSTKVAIVSTGKVTFATSGQLDSVTLNTDARGSASGLYTAAQVLSVNKDAKTTS